MLKKSKSIPVNHFDDGNHSGVSIEKLSITKTNLLTLDDDSDQTHRHDRHSFFLLESGTVHLEVDFQKYEINAPSVIYIHPDQVHHTIALDVTVSSWAINNENIHPEYLELLEEISPAKPLNLNEETFSLISDAVSLCMKFSERKDDKLYNALLRDSCNALVALVVSLYLEQSNSTDKVSRFETVTKAFRKTLERNYITTKRPTEYAQILNISTPYLNECVKKTTGYSVSHHIHERIILEAKRLLFYSDKSVKEIATELGYDDYPYFSRLFTKVSGMSALTFKNKNHD